MDISRQLETASIQDYQAIVAEYYHQALTNHKEAKTWLERRKLYSPGLLEQLKIGFSGRTLGKALPSATVKAGKKIRSNLMGLGLFKANGREKHTGGITVPLVDESGSIVNVYSHKIAVKLRDTAEVEMYSKGFEGIFNYQGLIGSKELIITKGVIDALSFLVHGYFNVTALLDWSIPPNMFSELCSKLGCSRVIFVFPDGSESKEWVSNAQQEFADAGVDLYQAKLPVDYTVNKYIVSLPNVKTTLADLIRTAQWQGKSKTIEKSELFPSKEELSETFDEVSEFNENENLDDIDGLEEITELVANAEEPELPDLPATRIPEPQPEQKVTEDDTQIVVEFSDRQYRVRGLYANTSLHRLKVSIFASFEDRLHIDDLNLYQSRSRAVFINQAKAELGLSEDIVKSDIGRLIFILEERLTKRLVAGTEVKITKEEIPASAKAEAIEYLRHPNLLNNILDDFSKLDVIGQDANLLVCYLAVTSRLLDDPLAITIQSASASGKTSLMNGVMQLVPDEHKVSFSSITSQSLYYMEETGLKNKVLAIAELDGLNKGSSAYSLKLLQSEKEISIATTLKDDKGNLRTVEKKVQGPVQFFCTTTKIDVDDELLNRTVVVSISDERSVTEAIHQIQRKRHTLEGLESKHVSKGIIRRHHNCQKLLKPVLVVNPYAEKLSFSTAKTRTRRDHQKYLNIIRAVTFLHQYQRPVKTAVINGVEIEYIESTPTDIQIANQIAHKVLGNCLLEDLPPQTQQLLFKINELVQAECLKHDIPQGHFRFTRSDIREHSGWSISQLKVHCKRLEELEYLVKHNGGRGKIIDYELLWDGEGLDGNSFSLGLIEPEVTGGVAPANSYQSSSTLHKSLG